MSSAPEKAKPGRKPLAPEQRRTGRLPFRVLPAVEEKAKRLGRDWLESLILKAKG